MKQLKYTVKVFFKMYQLNQDGIILLIKIDTKFQNE